jgi:hypothetical protein
MKDIDTIQDDPKFEEFCQLAYYFYKEYGVKVWHPNVFQPPNEEFDLIKDFYEPLEACGFDSKNEIYCYGTPEDEHL